MKWVATRVMIWALVLIVSATCFPVRPVAAAEDPVFGAWGPLRDGAPKCQGTAVMVFRDGKYFRVLPRVGTSVGTGVYVMSRSVYRFAGNQLVIEPSLSLSSQEPRQIFVLQRGETDILELTGRNKARYGRCPDIDPDSGPKMR